MSGSVEYREFYAICNHMPGADRVLRVGGTVVFPTSGWSAEITAHEHQGAPPFNPRVLELDLTVTAPADGVVVTRAETSLELEEYRVEDPALEYEQVHFYLVGREGEDGPGPIEVVHPE